MWACKLTRLPQASDKSRRVGTEPRCAGPKALLFPPGDLRTDAQLQLNAGTSSEQPTLRGGRAPPGGGELPVGRGMQVPGGVWLQGVSSVCPSAPIQRVCIEREAESQVLQEHLPFWPWLLLSASGSWSSSRCVPRV